MANAFDHMPNFDRYLDPDDGEPVEDRMPKYTFCRACHRTTGSHLPRCPFCQSTDVEHAGGWRRRRGE